MLILFTSCASVLVSQDPDTESIVAPAETAFVWDVSEESPILYSKNGSDRVYPASITKLATALYSMEILSADTVIYPGEETYFPREGSSSAYIRPHHALTLEMLIEGMLLPSGNDAAYAIAVACGRAVADDEELDAASAVDIFVDGMNEYTKSIGCTQTFFTTPDGFAGNEHYSSTYDIALIARAAVENELIMKYAGLSCDDVVYASGHINHWVNTNEFLDPSSEYYNEHVIGLKTGSTDGNYCLVTVYKDGEKCFIIGVFGCPSDSSRYIATKILMNNR